MGNASRTELRRPGQRGVTAFVSVGGPQQPLQWVAMRRTATGRVPRRGLLHEYREVRNRNWFLVQTQNRPEGCTQEADDAAERCGQRRNHSDEVETLQSRTRDFVQRQSDQMDDWDRALR